MNAKKKYISFVGIVFVNFLAMLIMCGVGVYGYAAVNEFERVEGLSLMITAETAARCIMIPFSGVLGEKYGRKRVYTISVIAYIAAYTAAVISKTFTGFTISRTVSGLAWGLFITNSLVLIRDLFQQDEAPIFSGYLQTATTVAMAVGAPLAGVLCTNSWRWEFYTTLPLMGIGLLISIAFLPNRQPSSKIAIDKSNTNQILGLTKYSDYIMILAFTFLFNISNATGNYLSAFAQSGLGRSTFLSSLITTPGVLIAIIAAPLISRLLVKKKCYFKVLRLWMVVCIVGFGSWYLSVPEKMSWQLCYMILMLGYMISGIGTGISQICPYAYSMYELSDELVAVGVSLVGFIGTFGALIANALCSVIQNSSQGLYGVLQMGVFPPICMLILYVVFKSKEIERLRTKNYEQPLENKT